MSPFRRRPLVCLVLALACLQIVPAPVVAGEVNRWSARIEQVINSADYRQSHWGILVVDAKTGEVVFALNADRLFLPASVTKIFSVAAALGLLGADFRFETPVYRRGEVVRGRLKGDLILVASGDVTLGGRDGPEKDVLVFKDHDHTYANGDSGKAQLTDTDPLLGLKMLARQVAAGGIKHVEGEVLIDDRLFERIQSTGSGPRAVSPIVVNDNLVDVLITPAAKAGELATVKMRPETSYVRMDAFVKTVAAGQPTKIEVKSEGGERFSVRGQIAVTSRPQVRIYGVEDPAAFARCLFIETLRREGITVAANPLQAPRAELPEKQSYGKRERVALFRSAPLSEVAKVTLKVSHNLYASTLPMLVAAQNGQRTLADGLRRQRQFLAKQGVDVSTISFGGGAGGAGADHVTPRATVELLRALARRPDWKRFEAALPVLGVDGTLVDVVGPNSPARGSVKAKTGTYFWIDLLNGGRTLLTSKALAGTMRTARGRELVFAMFVNNVPLPPGVTAQREGRVLGQLCEIIHQHAP
ncbi:MAG: D-alanyl-D-alanine carboxypeptidase/D-alanyl-D-alanine-endopeptidase [Gemmataceae bacterium]|nr:D-alanyl-D-alanine carboxypeptidase/D-alanyl-D-alanine-endopeptidase [Gemmataceae bacterium]